jgi:ankyrin repeat protein
MVTAKTTNGWTPLFHAVNGMKGGHLEIVQWLIDTWAVPVDERDHENKTPLHVASRLGFVPIAKYLIDHNAMVNSVTKDGYTPLHWAALYDKKEIAALLIEKGATVNAQNRVSNLIIVLV